MDMNALQSVSGEYLSYIGNGIFVENFNTPRSHHVTFTAQPKGSSGVLQTSVEKVPSTDIAWEY